MKKYLLFFFLLIATSATAQIVIKGQVIDAATRTALAGASVYINNTTIGTTADTDGKFSLIVGNDIKLELVVSSIGYEKQISMVDLAKRENLLVALKSKDNFLAQIEVKAKKTSNAQDRTRWIFLFTKNLIGDYQEVSSYCSIVNPEDLIFDYNKDTRQLKVFTKGPIIIENKFLAYKIRLDLDAFEYNLGTNEVAYRYSVFFEQIRVSKAKMAKLNRARQSLYYGSNMHFMRSLYANTITNEGFKTFFREPVLNKEKFRINTIIQERKLKLQIANKNPAPDLSELFDKKDTVNYYKKIIRQKDTLSYMNIPVNPERFVKRYTNRPTINFNFSDTLKVIYQRTLRQLTKLIDKDKLAEDLASERTNPVILVSYFYMFGLKGINVLPNGYYYEFSLFMAGDMAKRRLAGLLPSDYDPDAP